MDIHNHTHFSPDSDALPEDMIAAAIHLGYRYFGISEHVDLPYQPDKREISHVLSDYINVADYFCNMQQLKKQYQNKICILTGLEFGYNPRSDQNIFLEIEHNNSLDYVINSVHVVNGLECYFADNQKHFTGHDMYDAYLDVVYDSLSAPYAFEVVGHLGYVCRNTPFADKTLHDSYFQTKVKRILQGIIDCDASLELNTSVSHANSDSLASSEIVQRYYQLGGRNVSFGSDAHAPNRVGSGWQKIKKQLQAIGLKGIDIFINRQRITLPFEE